jgi:hypothetical protein
MRGAMWQRTAVFTARPRSVLPGLKAQGILDAAPLARTFPAPGQNPPTGVTATKAPAAIARCAGNITHIFSKPFQPVPCAITPGHLSQQTKEN